MMHTIKGLMKKTRPELGIIAGGLGVEVKQGWHKGRVAKAIVECERKAGSEPAGPQPKEPQPKEPPKAQPASPDFEQAAAVPAEPPKGGVRPGAGRPLGMTDEKAKVKNLSQLPNQSIKAALQFLFTMWAERVKIKEIALSSEEGDTLALPATQLAEYYGGNIPEIAWTWFMMGAGLADVVYAKVTLIREVNKQKESAKVADGQAGH